MVLLASYGPSLVNFRGTLIKEMVARGHQVFGLAPGLDGRVAERVRALGATPVPMRLANSTLNPIASIRTFRQIRALLRKIRPDLVLAYTIKPIVLGSPAARSARVPSFVALITGVGFAFTPGRELKRLVSRFVAAILYRRAFRRSKLAIFQNEDDREYFRRLGLLPEGLRTELVNGSGVDLTHFRAQPPPPSSTTSFLMVARLLGDKGVREYGEAARRLKRQHPDVRIVLAGGPFPSPDCLTQREIDAIGAGGVEFIGPLEDVRPALAACSVFVLPSYREGTPRAVLEAMSVGRAVITTDAPGCRETVIDGENGFLVPPRDADALYEAMVRFVEMPELAQSMGASSRKVAEEKYDVRKVNKMMLAYLGL